MAELDAGSLFVQIIPSFKGVQKAISTEAKKWSRQVNNELSDGIASGIRDGLAKGTKQAAAEAAKDGKKAGDAFARGFKASLEKAMANLPDAKIDADSSKADKKVDALRARLAALSDKEIGVDINSKAATKELTKIQVQLDRLARKSPDIRVKLDTKAASSELAKFRAEVDAASGPSKGARFGAFAAAVPQVSALTGAVALLGTTAIPILASLTAGAAAFAGGLAAMGLGLGGILAVAIPAFSRISDAQGNIAAAQQNVAKAAAAQKKAEQGVADAKTAAQKATAAKNLAAANQNLAKARGDLTKANNAMTPSERGVAAAMQNAKSAFTAWSKALEPAVMPMFAQGLNLLAPILHALTPLVQGAARGFSSFLADIGNFVKSPWFQDFMGTMGMMAQTIIPLFGKALLSLAQALGRIFVAAQPLTTKLFQGLADMMQGFNNWTASPSFTQFINFLKQELPVVGQFLKNIWNLFLNLVKAITPIGVVVLPILSSFVGWLSKLPTWVLRDLVLAIFAVIAGFKAFNIISMITAETIKTGLISSGIGLLLIALTELLMHWNTVWPWIQRVTAAVVAWFQTVFVGTFQAVINWFIGIWTNVRNFFVNIWNAIRGFAVSVWNAIWNFFVSAFASFTRMWVGVWNGVKQIFVGAWNGIRNTAVSVWNGIVGFFRGAWSSFSNSWRSVLTGIGKIWSDVWNGIKNVGVSIWSGITNVFKSGVNAVINAANWLIDKIDDVLGFFHIPKIPKLATLATGGEVQHSKATSHGRAFARGGLLSGPGTGTSDSILGVGANGVPTARVSNGEYVVNAKSTAAFLPLLEKLNAAGLPGHASGGMVGGLPGYGLGGLISNIGHGISNVAGHVFGGVKDAMQWVSGSPSAIYNAVVGSIKGILGNSWATDIGLGTVKSTISGAVKYITDLVTGGGGGQGKLVKGGGGAAKWAPQILQALSMLGQPASLLGTVERRMTQESGGNPLAINNWDSNAAKGTPSKGLMQVIDPTFAAYAGPLRGLGIWNPLANIYAGLNYAIHRYPSLAYAMNKPGGYATGGQVGARTPSIGSYASLLNSGLGAGTGSSGMTNTFNVNGAGMSPGQVADAIVQRQAFAMR